MKEHVVVVGQSAFALSIAAEFLMGGAKVTVFDQHVSTPTQRMLHLVESSQNHSFTITVTPSIGLFYEATIIIANFGGSYDKSFLDAIAPCIRTDQLFVVFPGYFLTESIHSYLKEQDAQDCLFCEITSSPCVCELVAPDTIQVFKRKKRLKIATVPDSAVGSALQRLSPYLPMLCQAKNIIETSLENINSILHPLPILLNLPAVARDAQQFRHYIDGIDSHVSQLLHLMDEERLRVGTAWDLQLEPTIEHLKVFYGTNDAHTIEEYIHTPECPYDDIRGYGLDSRYITLDVPHLIVPTIQLAKQKQISTPLFDACLSLSQPFIGLLDPGLAKGD